MTLKIIHKNNTSAGQAPASSDLDIGEIAVNSADAELYTKDTNGNIRKFQNTTTGTADGVQFTQAGTGAVQRTVESKLQDVVSVKDFGAVGDGVTDDTAAIQAALDYCRRLTSGGGSVELQIPRTCYMPAGNYKVTDTLELDTRVSVIGDGSLRTNIISHETSVPILELKLAAGSSSFFVENATLKGLSFRYANLPEAARDTYVNAIGIKITSDAYSAIWEDILVTECQTGVRATGSFFDTTMNNVTASNCYTGFNFLSSPGDPQYITSLVAKLVCYACFFGIRMDNVTYSSLATFMDNCGLTRATVASYCSDSTLMPIGLDLVNSDINITWFGSEYTNAVLLRTQFTRATIGDWGVYNTSPYKWKESATRVSNIAQANQAVISIYNFSQVTFTSFAARYMVSDGFSSASTDNSALFYIADSRVHMCGAPTVAVDAYYFSKQSSVLYLTHNNINQPILGMQHPQLTFDSNVSLHPIIPYGNGAFDESPMGPPVAGRIGQMYSANEPLTGIITAGLSINTVNLPRSPEGFKIKLIKETDFSVSSVVPDAADTFGPSDLISINITSDGDYWLLEKIYPSTWALLDGRNSGSAATGDYVLNADGTATYTRKSLSFSGTGTRIENTSIAHPITFAAAPFMAATLTGMDDSELDNISIIQVYNIATTGYSVRVISAGGYSFPDPTGVQLDIMAFGRWY